MSTRSRLAQTKGLSTPRSSSPELTDERFEIAAPNQLPRITTPWDYSCPLISVAYKLDSISCILSYRGIRRSYPKGPVRNLAPGAGGRGGLDAARTCPGRATDAAGPVPDGRRTPAGAGRAPDAAGHRRTPAPDASPDAAGRRRRTSGRKVPNRLLWLFLSLRHCTVGSPCPQIRRVPSEQKLARQLSRLASITLAVDCAQKSYA